MGAADEPNRGTYFDSQWSAPYERILSTSFLLSPMQCQDLTDEML